MSNTHRDSRVLATVVAFTLTASSAWAQGTDGTSSAAAGPQESPGTLGISEIVVTATKREESLQDVPIAVSVLTDEAIRDAGITRPSDFLLSTPNVTFIEDNAGEAYVNIRGQTSVRNSDPNVAVVIDGVVLSSTKPFNQDLFDIEQIEVLKGPQSALYGRNAAAGAIVITTRRPRDILEGSVALEVGRFDLVRTTGSLTGPLTENLKFSVAASHRETDGPFKSVTTGDDVHRFRTTLGRTRLLYEPNERLSVDFRFGGHHSKGSSMGYNAQLVGLPLGNFPGTALDANNADMPFVSNVDGRFEEDLVDGVLKVDYDLGFATLTSITGASKFEQFFGGDSPPYIPDTGSPDALTQGYTYDDKNFSQEIRLTSPGAQRLRWQAGVYFLSFEREQFSELNVDTLGSLPPTDGLIDGPDSPQPTVSFGHQKYRTTSYAPFVSFQYDLTESLQLGLAGRYDIEKRKVREVAPADINPVTGVSYNTCVAFTGRPVDECHASKTFKQFEPKVSLNYRFSPEVSAYVSYGKGFKSGGFNPIGSREALIAAAVSIGLPASSVYVQDQFSEEVSTSYELGVKARLFRNRLSINAAVFHTEIEGAQQFEFYPTVGLQTVVSVDEVKLKGFDLDFDALLPGEIRLFGGYGYTDGEISRFAGNPSFNGNISPGAFKYTLTLGATREFRFGADWALVPRMEFNRYGEIWWDVANTAGTRRDPLELLNARLSLKSGDRWEISAYGRNLTDETYFQEVVPLLGVLTVNFRGQPRTYGVEARVNF